MDKFRKSVFMYQNYGGHPNLDHFEEPTTEINPDSNSTVNFLKISFDLGYYQLIIPFRFKRDGEWGIHKHIVQQILCGISHTLLLYQYFTEIRSFHYHKLNKEPTEYFKWFHRIASFIYHVLFVKVLWMDKKKFLRIMQFLNQTPNLPNYPSKIQSKIVVYCFCLFYIIVSIACQVFGHSILADPTASTNLSWFHRRYVQTARYNFFLSNQTNITIAPKFEEITTIDNFLAVVTFLGFYFRNMFAYYCDALVLMACLTLWVPVKGYSSMIRSEVLKISEQALFKSSIGVSRITKSYYALRQLSLIVNEAMGYLVLTFMVDNITYFSTHLNALFIATNWLNRLRAGTLFMNSVAILCISGDICKQVEEMQEWLSLKEVGESISPNQFSLFVHEVKHPRIGISGNIFVINYTAIFNILATLVTYFIVCSQGEHD